MKRSASSAAALSARSYTDASHRVFVTPRRVHFVESEYAVPRESLAGVLAELRRAVPRLAEPVMFPVEVRVGAADGIWLSAVCGLIHYRVMTAAPGAEPRPAARP